MSKVRFKLGCQEGLHARVASNIVQSVENLEATVTLTINEKEARANSIISLILLEGRQGDLVTVESEGEDAEKAICVISDILMQQSA